MKEKVMIFGVFDGLHDGHRFFIKEAQKYAKQLYIVITTDQMVMRMKDHRPKYTLFERVQMLEKEFPRVNIVVGDKHLREWRVLKENNPDIIALGYDQNKLFNPLSQVQEEYNFELIQIKESYKGDKLHSSLIHKK